MAACKALSDASIRWFRQTKDEFIHNMRQKNCLARQGTSICLPQRSDPVIHASCNDAKAYCEWLSEKSGQTYRLPTEAEWEYVAGNGAKHTKYSWGNGQPSGKKQVTWPMKHVPRLSTGIKQQIVYSSAMMIATNQQRLSAVFFRMILVCMI